MRSANGWVGTSVGLSARRSWPQAMLLAFTLSAAGIAQASENPPQVASCQGCHQGALGFEGRCLDELTAAIRELAASGKPHPPLPVQAGAEEDAEALAQALLEAASKGAAEK